MTIDEYQQFVLSKMNPEVMESEESIMLNAMLGLGGETGECLDLVKKWLFHGHDLDLAKLEKELGDQGFYWVLGCRAIGKTPSEVIRTNVDKLNARYKGGFTVAESKAKNDEISN